MKTSKSRDSLILNARSAHITSPDDAILLLQFAFVVVSPITATHYTVRQIRKKMCVTFCVWKLPFILIYKFDRKFFELFYYNQMSRFVYGWVCVHCLLLLLTFCMNVESCILSEIGVVHENFPNRHFRLLFYFQETNKINIYLMKCAFSVYTINTPLVLHWCLMRLPF